VQNMVIKSSNSYVIQDLFPVITVQYFIKLCIHLT